jgi:hypothetical protein
VISATPEGTKVASGLKRSFVSLRLRSVISQTSKLHAAHLQLLDGDRVRVAVRVLGVFEQKVDPARVRHDDDLRLRIHLQMIADVAQCVVRLSFRVVDVVDHLVGSDRTGRGRDGTAAGEQKGRYQGCGKGVPHHHVSSVVGMTARRAGRPQRERSRKPSSVGRGVMIGTGFGLFPGINRARRRSIWKAGNA